MWNRCLVTSETPVNILLQSVFLSERHGAFLSACFQCGRKCVQMSEILSFSFECGRK